jgi:hypothetical protein
MTMRTSIKIAVALLPLTLGACGDDSVGVDFAAEHDFAVHVDDDGGTEVDAGLDGAVAESFPAPPTLGTQIDRFGRPAINTALTDPFWDDGVQTLEQHHARQDAYNASSDPAAWASLVLDAAQNKTVVQLFSSYLAIYDALDGNSDGNAATGTTTGCGNQLGFDATTGYATLATVLANDQLWVNTASGTCQGYLSLEAATLASTTPTDCGGRTPLYDVVDITYSALANGAFVTAGCDTGTSSCTLGDGVATDADSMPSASTFPFLEGVE